MAKRIRTWDILIPTIYQREALFIDLLDQLEKQMRRGVRVIAARDNRIESVGHKCQRLLEAATADYTAFLADDTRLHPHYVKLIHTAMQSDPDVIGFIMEIWNAEGPISERQRHSIAFHGIPAMLNGEGRYWGPFWCDLGTWMPMRRQIARMAEMEGGMGEDARWTRAVIETGLMYREVYFQDVLVMPQQLDGGFLGSWAPVEPTPDPQRDFLTYI